MPTRLARIGSSVGLGVEGEFPSRLQPGHPCIELRHAEDAFVFAGRGQRRIESRLRCRRARRDETVAARDARLLLNAGGDAFDDALPSSSFSAWLKP
jgi:hypothetical protein